MNLSRKTFEKNKRTKIKELSINDLKTKKKENYYVITFKNKKNNDLLPNEF